MGIVKSYPVTKIVAGKEIKTSDSILCTSDYYKTNGESAIVINSNTECTLVLDETTTDHVTIKAMSDVKVVTDKLIDDEFEEILLDKYSSVELRYIVDSWYIMSSDGLKNS
jgi:hypothetical protein